MGICEQIVIKIGSWYFYEFEYPNSAPFVFLIILTALYLKFNPKLFWQPTVIIILPLIFWIVLMMIGVGNQSLAHLFELPVILLFSILVTIIRMLIYRKVSMFSNEIYVTIGMLILFVLFVRIFTPFIPE